jgi:DNA-binding ferritin-like protein
MMATTLREPITSLAGEKGTHSEVFAAAVESLDQRLADAIDLQLQTKHAQWDVKGRAFSHAISSSRG